MNRSNAMPLAIKRFKRSNTYSHELQNLTPVPKPPQKMCYFVVFKYLACDGYQNGHDKGIPKTHCTDPLCIPKIESVPGFCPECIAISMRDDSSSEKQKKRKKTQRPKTKMQGTTEVTQSRGPRIKYDEITKRKSQAAEMDNQRADVRPGQLKRTGTSSSRRSGDSKSSGGFGGYENNGRIRRPSNSYGGYSYKEFVVSEMSPRDLVHETEEEVNRRWSPKPSAGGFRSLFKFF